ncbi:MULTISPECIES: hypothetical protein [Comamonas]|uniref:hypothetical protein n=1 Tax=Comamonas TaxID=283 RepID=UPI0003085863|nr:MULTISPECIES: hypothetical protein [Comamonas]
MKLRSVGLRTGEQILQGIREARIWRADQQAACLCGAGRQGQQTTRSALLQAEIKTALDPWTGKLRSAALPACLQPV